MKVSIKLESSASQGDVGSWKFQMKLHNTSKDKILSKDKTMNKYYALEGEGKAKGK